MFIKRNWMVGLMLWALLGATNAYAQAHTHAHHSHDHSQITSPFDKDKSTQSLHCQLNGHKHLGFCPYTKSDSNKGNLPTLSVDCGGKASGTIPNVASFSNDFAEIELLSSNHFRSKYNLTSSTIPLFHSFIDSLDPPPRAL
jgi:hypothetical protein